MEENSKVSGLLIEYKSALESLTKLIGRKAEQTVIRYQAKVVSGINNDILDAVCGDVEWNISRTRLNSKNEE